MIKRKVAKRIRKRKNQKLNPENAHTDTSTEKTQTSTPNATIVNCGTNAKKQKKIKRKGKNNA